MNRIKRLMAVLLSLVMVFGCIPCKKANASAGTYIPFIYYEMQDVNTGDYLRDIAVDGMSLIMYDTSIGYAARDKIDIDLNNCTFTYLLKPDDDFVPAEVGENPEIEPNTTYGLEIVSYIHKSELDKYSITASELQDAQYYSACRTNHGKDHNFGYSANNFTAIEDGDNIKLTSIVEYNTYDQKKLTHVVTINRDKVEAYFNDKTDTNKEAMINSITNDFDSDMIKTDLSLEVEYIEESFPTFINEELGINIPGIKYPTLRMRFNFERGYVETISGIVVKEVNDEGQELSHKTLIFDEDNKYRTDNDYFYLHNEDGTNWGARIGYDANIGYQFDFTNNDNVRVYFPDYYDYDDVANTWTLKDGASLDYLPIETTRNEEVELAKLNGEAATGDILGWSLYKESGNYFAEKINVYKDISLYAFDGDLELIEQPTSDNNYTVKTNKSELCEDYLTYNWYKVELDEDFTYTRCENEAEYNASGSEPRIYFKAKRDENKVSNIYNYDGRKVLDLSQKNLPANTVITYTFNNDIDLSSKYVEKFLDDYVYDRTNKTITVRKNPDTRYLSFTIYSSEDLSGTYKVEVEKEERKLIDCHTSNLVATEDGYYICEVYGKDDTKKLYTTHVYYEAPKISSGSKKYKADDKDTAEKISGSGKKGSTRTITPIEGKKVLSVNVTDKNGNKVDVTLNEDGTYSFIQPASDVNVEVNYKNREIKLTIGSTEASVDDVQHNLDVCPLVRNDRTMLPIRFVAENLGAKVEWNEKNPDTVIITRGETKIEITLGSDIAKVNGEEYKLDSVAFAENDRTYMPVRFISEKLNAIVEWNEKNPNDVIIKEQ